MNAAQLEEDRRALRNVRNTILVLMGVAAGLLVAAVVGTG